MPQPRVVITGMGAITPLGATADAYWQALVAGRSGVRAWPEFEGLPVRIAGRVRDFDAVAVLGARAARRMARFTQLALVASREAVASAGFEADSRPPERVGVEIGSATGSVETIVEQQEIMAERGPRALVPTVIPGGLINMAACQVAIELGFEGPGGAPVAACATGLYAIGDAWRRIRRGEADAMVAGAGESFLHPLAVAAFWRIRALSTRNEDPEGASRPFAADRDGTVMAEGAAVVMLEREDHARARGAPILAEIAGYGLSSDARHIIAPDVEGRSAARAIRAALDEARLRPDEVDWISAHGTATPLNDVAETNAIRHVFGDHASDVAVSALKSMSGHMLGAAGAASVIATVRAIGSGVIPPTINLHHPDPDLDLDYVPLVARERPVRVALSNAFGFGGQNACLVVRRYESQ